MKRSELKQMIRETINELNDKTDDALANGQHDRGGEDPQKEWRSPEYLTAINTLGKVRGKTISRTSFQSVGPGDDSMYGLFMSFTDGTGLRIDIESGELKIEVQK